MNAWLHVLADNPAETRVNYWEIIARNLKKRGWSWGCVSTVDSNGRQCSLRTRIAMTESVSLCVRMKS
jgi:hypothetical protein